MSTWTLANRKAHAFDRALETRIGAQRTNDRMDSEVSELNVALPNEAVVRVADAIPGFYRRGV